MNFEEHREQVFASIKAQERVIRHGQDWMPVLLVDGPEGATVYESPLRIAGTPAGSHFLARLLRAQVETRPLYLHWATLQTVYFESAEAEHEVVMVLLGTTTDVERIELWAARIYRPKNRGPVLGNFEKGGEPDGPMVAPFYEAIAGRPWVR